MNYKSDAFGVTFVVSKIIKEDVIKSNDFCDTLF